MPRPNKQRIIGAEDRLADRIELERNARGWSYAQLAEAMSSAGCPIDQTGCYKIEKGRPRRRITVDELVALSRVWRIPMDRLVSEVSWRSVLPQGDGSGMQITSMNERVR